MKAVWFLISALFVGALSVAAKKTVSDDTLLKETTTKYRNAAQVELDVEKTLKTDLNPEGQKHKGKIFLSSGLFRIENAAPEKSILVFDGIYIWNEQPPSPDFPGSTQVSKSKIDKKNRSQVAFATLLTKEPITKQFKILNSSHEGDLTLFKAEPLQKDSNIVSLILKIVTAKKEVASISYKDDIGNVTEMSFTHTKFNSKKNPKLYKYTPPKNVQVNDL